MLVPRMCNNIFIIQHGSSFYFISTIVHIITAITISSKSKSRATAVQTSRSFRRRRRRFFKYSVLKLLSSSPSIIGGSEPRHMTCEFEKRRLFSLAKMQHRLISAYGLR